MTYDQLTNREFAYFAVRGSGRHELITELVGLEPTEAYSDDDINPKSGKPFGRMLWRLNSGLDDKETFERHIAYLLLWLNRVPGAIKRLSNDYQLILQCVGYFPGSGHGAHLDRETIRILGQLGIAIDLDFYFVDDHGHNAEMH